MDNVSSRSHAAGNRLGGPLLPGKLRRVKRHDLEPLRAKLLHPSGLEFLTALEQNLHLRRLVARLQLAALLEDVEVGAVLAAEIAVERAWRLGASRRRVIALHSLSHHIKGVSALCDVRLIGQRPSGRLRRNRSRGPVLTSAHRSMKAPPPSPAESTFLRSPRPPGTLSHKLPSPA